jgi:fibronectin-binding autotransporter adhesin
MRRRPGRAARRMASVGVAALIAMVVGAPAASAVTITVDCSHDSLAAALATAPQGSTVKVTGTCNGNFLIDENLTLLGAPSAELNGGGTATTLTIFGFHAVHLAHLDITGGVAQNGGGIAFLGGGLLTMDHVKVHGNSANGGAQTPGVARGGGVLVRDPAFVTITNSSITNNHVTVSGANAETASGGGLSVTGQLTLRDSTVSANTASASSNNNAGSAQGAGIAATGTVSLLRTRVNGNQATGQGPEFGIVDGAGMIWLPSPHDTLDVVDSTMSSNQGTGTTPGSAGAAGGAIVIFVIFESGPATFRGSTLDGNQLTATSSGGDARADGGAIFGSGNSSFPDLRIFDSKIRSSSASATGATTAEGEGGGIWLDGAATLTRATLSDNAVTIHSGSGTATGDGGAAHAIGEGGPVKIVSSTIDGNTVQGTSDSNAASVSSGGVLFTGFQPDTIRTSTISHNQVTSTAAGSSSEADGGGVGFTGTSMNPGDLVIDSTITKNGTQATGPSSPDAAGGGVYVTDKHLLLRFDTIVRNSLTATGSTPFAGGGGLYLETGTDTHAQGLVLALNQAAASRDCIGVLGSDRFNLLGTSAGCTFTPLVSDQINPAPKLGSLADNGGPTQTVALLAGSPALNRVPVTPCHAMVARDQRGVLRPQGPKCDEGAFERKVA